MMLFGLSAYGQTTVGLQPGGSYAGSDLDQISLANLGLHVDIPLFEHHGRGVGMGTNVHLVYDSAYINGPNANGGSPFTDKGWRVVSSTASPGSIQVSVSNVFTPSECTHQGQTGCNGAYTTYSYNISFSDATGFIHFSGGGGDGQPQSVVCRPDSGICTNQNLVAGGVATDGSGYSLTVNPTTPSPYAGVVIVTAPTGETYTHNSDGTTTVTDTNGNSGSNPQMPAYWVAGTETLTDDTNITATMTGGQYNSSDYTKWTSRTPFQAQYADTQGHQQTVTVTYGMHVVTYNCAYSGVPAYSQTTGLVDSVTYQDGTGYQFTYQNDGNLSTMTLPTGGTITYDVSTSCASSGNPNNRLGLPATVSRSTLDGKTTYSQTITASNGNYPLSSTSAISKPDGSSEQISFVYVIDPETGANLNYETAHTWSDSSGVLQSAMKCYNGATGDCTVSPFSLPITQIATTTSRGNASSQSVTLLDSHSLPVETDEYDFGATAITRKTVTSYAAPSPLIFDRPSSVTVYDGTQITNNTQFSYDTNGNKTTQTAYLDSAGHNVQTQWNYDSAGQLTQVLDGRQNSTSYTYDSATDNCLISTTPPALPSGVSLATSSTCDSNTGLPLTSTDANGVTATLTYDSMLRVTASETRDASGTLVARTTHDYGGSSLPRVVTTTVTATPSPDVVSKTQLDGLGRASIATAPSGSIVKTAYDSMGNVQSVSNPYFSASDATYGFTSYAYDGLGRKRYQCQPDNGTPPTACTPSNSYQSWTYTDASVTFRDEMGNQWKRTSDGLGRLTQVFEPSSTSQAPTLETDYTFDLLNNLKSITQVGAGSEVPRKRYFGYDLMSRLLWSYNPESGVVCYGTGVGTISSTGTVTGCNPDGYDPNGNLQYKTDARGVQTSYSYDSLNRMTAKNYSGQTGDANSTLIAANTPESHYVYDLTSSGTAPYAKGRLVSEVTGSLATPVTTHNIGSYDALGRATAESESLTGYPVSSSLTRFYDLAGNLVYYDNGIGSIAFNSIYDSAGRLQTMTEALSNNVLFAPPTTGLQYGPVGMLAATYGTPSSTGVPQFTQKRSYDNRARLTDELNTMGGPATAGSGYLVFVNGDATHLIDYKHRMMIVSDTGTITAVLSAPGSSSPVYTGSLEYSGESMSDLASEVADKLNNTDDQGNPPVVHATVSLTQTNPTLPQVNITSLITGAASNYTFSLAYNPDFSDANDYPYTTSGLDLTGGQDASPTQELYHYGLTYLTNGNVNTVTDSVMGNWAYTYDPLNRLTSGQASAYPSTSASPYGTGLLGWSYDSFGNYLGQTFTGYSHATVTQTPFTYRNGNNRADGSTYDTSGNVTSNGMMALNYDAEGRLASTGQGTIYVYDAEGRRLAKEAAGTGGGSPTVTNFYILGSSGEQLSELDGNGNWLHSNAYANGGSLATYDASGVHFHFTDWLGTNRVQASGTGQVEQRCLSLPFGDGLNCSGTDSTEHHFTGKEHDAESGMDYFGSRYYAANMGRWISPDEVNVTEARMMNPSSTLNKYAYGANNPLLFVDRDGFDITYFYDQSGTAGHAILFAFDPKTGSSAIESFGPVRHRMRDKGKSMFDLDGPVTDDKLRKTYAAYTLTTDPILTQQVITYINTHPDPAEWIWRTPNCSSQVWAILSKFRLIDNIDLYHGGTPQSVWTDIGISKGTYPPGTFTENPDRPRGGVDYGTHSADPFGAFLKSIRLWQLDQALSATHSTGGGAIPAAVPGPGKGPND